MQAKELTEEIKGYMQCDAIGLQTLVLHGEWGSGKTYYCENDLKAALKDIDVKTCRVSLFGVSDYDEICNRVLASRLHIYENAKDRVGTAMNVFTKSAIEAGTSVLSNKLADLGIQVSVNSNLMLSLIDIANAVASLMTTVHFLGSLTIWSKTMAGM